MHEDIGITTIVTQAFLDEFSILKYSFELFHGTSHRWFVRCDLGSQAVLSRHANVTAVAFMEPQAARSDLHSAPFRTIMSEKMNVMEDAWRGIDGCRGVMFLDADIIFTAPLMPLLRETPGDVILVPNYYPPARRHLAPLHGEFNGGFAFTRSRAFAAWWRDAYRRDASRHNEQGCLDHAHEQFSIARLGPNANVGFWRAAGMASEYEAIPSDCLFLHVHLYQPLVTVRDWMDKSFALHGARFLAASDVPAHRQLLDRILATDRYGWYDASLRLCGVPGIDGQVLAAASAHATAGSSHA
jgi:hypothetical protein